MKKAYLVFLFLLVSFTFCNAQVTTGNLFARNTFKVNDDKLIVCGYVLENSKTIFVAALYDNKMNVLKKYEKDIPIEKITAYRYEKKYGDVLLIVIGGKPASYYLQLSTDLKEISFVEKNSETNTCPDGEKFMGDFQFELEGDAYGIGYAGGLRRKNEIKNQRFLKNDIFDFDFKTGLISRYTYNEKAQKLYPSYRLVWDSQIANGKNLKLTGFEFVDEEEILGSFIVKEDGEWKDYVCKLESKTGSVVFFKEVRYPDEAEVFSISNAFYDKKTKNFIVVGQLLLKKAGKDRKHAIGLLVYDSKGELKTSKKVEFPELNTEEPKGFDFKDKEVCTKKIGVSANGNYFICCENLVTGPAAFYANYLAMNPNAPAMVTMNGVKFRPVTGFSYFEFNNNFDLVYDNFRIVENFSQNYVSYAGFNSEMKQVVYSTIDGMNVSFSSMDLSSKDGKARELSALPYDFETLKNPDVSKRDLYACYFMEDRAILFQKKANTHEYTFRSILIK